MTLLVSALARSTSVRNFYKFSTAGRENRFADRAHALIKCGVLCSVVLRPAEKPQSLMPKRKKRLQKPRSSKRAARAKSGRSSAGEWFEKLVALQARLRAPKGCPWDIEQTHLSLR